MSWEFAVLFYLISFRLSAFSIIRDPYPESQTTSHKPRVIHPPQFTLRPPSKVSQMQSEGRVLMCKCYEGRASHESLAPNLIDTAN